MKLPRILFLSHRWLGIPLCLLFMVWFVSGVVMMYTRLPGLDAEERLAGLTPLNADTIKITPAEACARAGLNDAPRKIRLAMWQQRPAWFVLPKGAKWRVVFADDGSLLNAVTPEQAAPIAQAWLRSDAGPQFVSTVETIDQWTLSNSLNLHRPLHRFRFDDANETEIYVSQITGEVVQKSTRRERLLGWIGVIPHYGEFLFIRQYVGAWRQMMIWLAVFGTALAVTGIWAGLKRYRLSGYRMGDGSVVKSPYRGWMKWHHVTGLVFGTLTLTWIVSGMLYLNPGGTRNPSALDTNTTMSPYNVGGVRASNAPTAQQSNAFSGGALQPELFTLSSREALRQLPADAVAREIELLRFDGKPYLLCWDNTYTSWLVTADATASGDEARGQFTQETLLAKARQAVPNGQISESVLLTDSDLYYLAIGAVAPRRFPMLRVKFDDPDKTWLYIDPHTGSIARRYDTYGRGWRFVMNGLHTWDFLRYRPLWDIFMLVKIIGNPNLRPERTISYDAGAMFAKGRLWLDATVFWNDLKDRIGTVALTAQRSQFVNRNKSQVAGLELQSQISLGSIAQKVAFNLSANGVYHWRFRDLDAAARNLNTDKIERMYKYQGATRLTANALRWSASLGGVLNGPMYYESEENLLIPQGEPFRTFIHGKNPFWLVDTNFRFKLTKQFTAWTAVNNLLNLNQHPIFIALNRTPIIADVRLSNGGVGNSLPGRAFVVGLDFRWKK